MTDIPGMIGMLIRAYDASHYALDGDVRVDSSAAQALLVQAIQRHGRSNGGATFIQVAEQPGYLTGVIVGTLSRIYSIGDKLSASDLFWLAEDGVDPADPAQLMANFIEWARSNKNVREIKCGTTRVLSADPKRAGRILLRLGFDHYGEIYRMELKQ